MQAALDAWFTALSTMAADGRVRRLEDPVAAEAGTAAAFAAAARQAIRDRRMQREAELESRISTRLAYNAVLIRIGEGQAELVDRASHLSQEDIARQARLAKEGLRRASAPLLRASWTDGRAAAGSHPRDPGRMKLCPDAFGRMVRSSTRLVRPVSTAHE